MWEISENLHRAELGPAERAHFTAQRKELWERVRAGNQVEQVVPPEIGYGKPPPRPMTFRSR
jgi:hypothetical protein